MDLLELPQYHGIEFSIGNTDFQILFISNFGYQGKVWNSHAHFHLFCECHFLQTGKVLIQTETQDLTFEAGNFCLVPLRLLHTTKSIETPVQKISFYVVISQNKSVLNMTDTYTWYDHIVSSKTPLIFDGLSETFTKIMGLVQSADAFEVLLEMKLKHLFSLAFLELLEQSNESYVLSASSQPVGYEEELTLKIEAFLVDHFAPEYTLEDLATYLCLSARQTDRLLKRIFDCGFREIKNKKRIEVAKEMLSETRKSLKDIAEAVGYDGYTGFYKAFRTQTGLSPEEYRNMHSIS